MKRPDKTTIIALGITALALGIRLYRLGSESLWVDEGFSLRDTYNLSVLHETRPLFFLLMQGWMKLIGNHSEFFLRLPAALFGTASVWVLFKLGRRLMGDRTALLASFFMALSVLQINHSREIRMYTMTGLIALLATYVFILAIDRKKPVYVVGYALLSLAGLLTSAVTAFILAAHGVFLLLYLKAYRPISYWLIAVQLIVVGAWYPWMKNNALAAGAYSEGYTSILDKPTPRGIVEFFGKFYIWKWSDPGKLFVLASLAFSFAVFILVLYSLKKIKRTDSETVFTWLWVGVPMVSIIIVSYTIANMWMIHYLIASSPAVFLLTAKGINSLNSRKLAITAISLITIVCLGRLGLYMGRHVRPEWKPAISYLEAHEMPGDVIGIFYGGYQYVFRYYYQGNTPWSPLGHDQVSSEQLRGWDEKKAAKLISSSPNTGKRFWLLLLSNNRGAGPSITKHIASHYRVLDHKYYSQIELILFDANGRTVPNRPARVAASVKLAK
ncbi:MAG TPA: glycosyltransferase family 39 protein [Armatimonadota bacterium]|jgi:4-amino-4-deoxy-L-arabinose transferase-like glycosyltransferase